MEPRCYILIASLSSLDTPLINDADREHSGTPTVVLHNDASLTILDISRLCVGARRRATVGGRAGVRKSKFVVWGPSSQF